MKYLLGLLLFLSLNVNAADWTLLVYMNGFNSLDSFGAMDINEMEEVGSTKDVNVVVQYGSLKTKKAKRYFIQKDNNKNVVSSPFEEVEDSLLDMGDYNNLVEFVSWGMKKYPAKKIFVDVWNHGSGVRKKSGMNIEDISFDDISGHAIDTKQLGKSMREISDLHGDKIELYGSDACLMAMVEIAAEMKDSVKYFVGSEDLEPGDGWEYASVLKIMNEFPDMNGGDLGKEMVKSFIASHPLNQVTFSALDLSKIDEVMHQSKYLVNKIKTIQDVSQYKKAVKDAQKFYYQDYVDMSHFVSLLPIQFNELKKSLNELILGSDQIGFQNAMGAAVWLPNKQIYKLYSNKYKDLVWEKETNWSSLIKLLME